MSRSELAPAQLAYLFLLDVKKNSTIVLPMIGETIILGLMVDK